MRDSIPLNFLEGGTSPKFLLFLFQRNYTRLLFVFVPLCVWLADVDVNTAWPRVKDEVEEKAERVTGILGLAKHHLILQV